MLSVFYPICKIPIANLPKNLEEYSWVPFFDAENYLTKKSTICNILLEGNN
jgi:hypothetical protein